MHAGLPADRLHRPLERRSRPRRAVPKRRPGRAVWANQKRNQVASARILARYANLKPTQVVNMTRTPYATRLRLVQTQPWIDLYAEYDLIPDSFTPADLLK